MTQFADVQLSVVGGTDEGRSKQQSSELSQNCYLYVSGDVPALHGTPGSTTFSAALSTSTDRGFHTFQGELHQVIGTNLEKIALDSVRTVLATIPGTGRCIFADDGTDMFIVTDGVVYRWNTSLSTITTNMESPNSVAYLNKKFFYDGSGGRFGVSEPGDGSDVQSDSFAEAESDPDDLLRVYTFDQKAYMMGAKTIEPWYDSGTGSPPVDRIDTGIIQKGLGAIYSVSQTDAFMYFLGDDLNVYQLTGSQVRSLANTGVAKEINLMSATSDAIGFCFNLEGLDFYCLTFPTGNKSFLYSEQLQEWITLSFGVSGDRHLANSYSFVYGRHLIADRRTGSVLEWSLDTYEDVGEVIQRRRIIPNINGTLLNAPGRRLLMDSIEVEMQKGLGLASGQGSDPILMLEMSFDGAQTWDIIYSLRSGEAGEFDGKVIAYNMHSFYDGSCRITQSDPTMFNVRGMSIKLGAAGY